MQLANFALLCAFLTNFVHFALIACVNAFMHISGEETYNKKIGKHFEPYIYEFSLFWPITWVGGLHYSYDIAYRGSSS